MNLFLKNVMTQNPYSRLFNVEVRTMDLDFHFIVSRTKKFEKLPGDRS